ncbi:MAG TPA: pyruvate, phosphate dikinase, partial [Rhodobacteraceae bacterium]|nr:pyruvate, phosphate dikinase [Paracoccaceae bacterium]
MHFATGKMHSLRCFPHCQTPHKAYAALQRNPKAAAMIFLDGKTELNVHMHGTRACRLAKMATLGLPVPESVVLSAADVSEIAKTGIVPDVPTSLLGGLLSLRASPLNPEWGGPTAILNIGISDSTLPDVGETAAYLLYRRFIQSYATNVAGLEAEDFDADIPDGAERVAHCKASYLFEADEAFPQDPKAQLKACILHMARAWNRPSAKILRQAKGAPEDAGFALVIQRMALGIGRGETGAGAAQTVDDKTGEARLWGRYLPQSQGQDAIIGGREAQPIDTLPDPVQT